MSYRIFLERYEWMNEKKANKRCSYILKKEKQTVRRIYFRDPSKKKKQGRAEFQIVMRNFDADRIHLEERITENGRVYCKTVWILKEECEKILKNDLDWMIHRESVVFDLYYHIVHEGYRMAIMDEMTEQMIRDEKEELLLLLKKIEGRFFQRQNSFLRKNLNGNTRSDRGNAAL